MAADEGVTFRSSEVSYTSGALFGGCAGTFVATLPYAVLHIMSPLSDSTINWITALVILAGATLGAVALRREVYRAAFTRDHVHLVSRGGTRTVAVTDLLEVRINHTGDTAHGYTATVLSLSIAGRRRITIRSRHSPELGDHIIRSLGTHAKVTEIWEEREELPDI
ncbi:hypothetical protein [Streptomyces sp. NPDC050560]|uniref:hypothetical protein n=1 Tax=Streptomyces sp. NPDC050560 TaxID=3365630 RepID=UPI00378D605F